MAEALAPVDTLPALFAGLRQHCPAQRVLNVLAARAAVVSTPPATA